MAERVPPPRLDIDALQATIINRAAQLRMTEQQIAEASGVSAEHVHDYLVRRATMNSFKVAKLLKALRLKVVPDDPSDAG